MKIHLLLTFLFCASHMAYAGKIREQQDLWKLSLQQEQASKLSDAITSTTNFVELGGDKYLGAIRLGWLYYNNKDFKNAEKYYKIAVRYGRGSITPILGLANTYNTSKEYIKAAKTYKSVLSIDKNNYTAIIALAGIYYSSRDYRSSGSLYKKVSTLYPEDTDALSGLAWSLYFQGKKDESKVLFARLLTLSSDYAYAEKGFTLSGGKL